MELGKVLLQNPPAAAWTMDWVGSKDVASDGRFLINMFLDSAAAPITLLMNWNPEAAK